MNEQVAHDLAQNSMAANVQAFAGFEPITANYLYCPNQFFDICMKSNSRGMVRIVAYILRQTIGWLDKDGLPINDKIKVSYRDLIEKAGVSRGAIGPALQRAVASGFIECVIAGNSKSAGQSSQTAEYSMRWDESGAYQKTFTGFEGFYTGEGNRTPIPNAFFERIVPTEPLAVTKVVGTVLRNTVGHWTQFGGRKTEAELSYSHIQNYANVNDRKTLAAAIRTAIESGYIKRTNEGNFDSKRQRQMAASYSVRWLVKAKTPTIGSKNPPAIHRFKKPPSIGSKTPPDDRFKNPTSIKTTNSKDIIKQQNNVAAFDETVSQLVGEGISRRSAEFIVKNRGVAVVQRQLNWLDARKPRNNRAGLLRKAIEEDWAEPEAFQIKQKIAAARIRDAENEKLRRAEETKFKEQKRIRIERKNRLLKVWEAAAIEHRTRWIEAAIKSESTSVMRNIIRRNSPEDLKPHSQVLDELARELSSKGVNVANSSTQ